MALAALAILANLCGAKVRLEFDCGGCGPLQNGWIAITSGGTYTDVGGTDIDLTVAVGDGASCDCGRKRREGSRGILNAFEIYYEGPISTGR